MGNDCMWHTGYYRHSDENRELIWVVLCFREILETLVKKYVNQNFLCGLLSPFDLVTRLMFFKGFTREAGSERRQRRDGERCKDIQLQTSKINQHWDPFPPPRWHTSEPSQGIAGLPGPIGIDGVPGSPGQRGEKVRIHDVLSEKSAENTQSLSPIEFVLQGSNGIGIQGIQGPRGEPGEKVKEIEFNIH